MSRPSREWLVTFVVVVALLLLYAVPFHLAPYGAGVTPPPLPTRTTPTTTTVPKATPTAGPVLWHDGIAEWARQTGQHEQQGRAPLPQVVPAVLLEGLVATWKEEEGRLLAGGAAAVVPNLNYSRVNVWWLQSDFDKADTLVYVFRDLLSELHVPTRIQLRATVDGFGDAAKEAGFHVFVVRCGTLNEVRIIFCCTLAWLNTMPW